MAYHYITVAVTAMIPVVGEELVTIPLGVGLGLPPAAVAITAIVFNFIPAVLISLLFHRSERSTGLHRWLTRLRRDSVRRVLDRFGIPGVVVVTPWVGVYGIIVPLEILGMSRRRILGSVLVSLVIYAPIFAVASDAVLRLFGR